MQHFSGNRKRRAKLIIKDVDLTELYTHRLQLYRLPPTEEISLEDFEKFAIERLKVLREVENCCIRFKRGTPEYDKKLNELIDGFNTKEAKYNESDNATERRHKETLELLDRRKDHISHFILRLAFCRSEDLRRWFLQQEMELFRFRFQKEGPEAVDEFLKANDLEYHPIDKETKDAMKDKLAASGYDLTEEVVTISDYYKVHFTEALDLVKHRLVYIHQGYAYVPRQELVSIIVSAYRSQLSHHLAVTSRKLPHLEEDERILPMLKNLSTLYIGEAYSTRKSDPGERVTPDQIDGLSQISFPLCMRQLHEHLRKEHHMKHSGRLQYGLFIKGLGLTLEEALSFWRTEFTKMMDCDKFDKQYSYNIRHAFGKEGKRTDYTPYSCMKIIMGNQPGPGDSHGCPFKHSDPEILSRRLQMYKVSKEGIDEIINLVKGQHYQIACAKYFEYTHKVQEAANISVNHPNQYFDESVKLLKNIKNEAGQTGSSGSSGFSSTPVNVKTVRVKQEGVRVKQEEGVRVKQEEVKSSQPLAVPTNNDIDFEMDDLDAADFGEL